MYFSNTLLHVFVFCTLMESVLTAPDYPLITPKPRAPTRAQLEGRQDDTGPNTYGYIEGDANSPLACGAGYQFSTDGSLGLCCNQVGCTNMIATCVDKNGGLDVCSGAYSDLCALSSVSVLHCKSPSPSCFRYMRITDAQDTNPVFIHRCGTVTGDITVFAAATNEAAVSTEDPTSIAKVASSVRSTAIASKTQGSAAGATSSPDPASPQETGTGTSTTFGGNTWKYAVIGVGCVVVILALLGVIFCLWRRSRKIKPVLSTQGGVAHNPVGIQYMETVDGSVAGDISQERRDRIGKWTQSQSGLRPDTISESETLVNGSSRGGYSW